MHLLVWINSNNLEKYYKSQKIFYKLLTSHISVWYYNKARILQIEYVALVILRVVKIKNIVI